MSSFLDTIAVLIVFAPWLVGTTVNIVLENSRWRGIATCTAVIIALVAIVRLPGVCLEDEQLGQRSPIDCGVDRHRGTIPWYGLFCHDTIHGRGEREGVE